jgi:hypothetical protein
MARISDPGARLIALTYRTDEDRNHFQLRNLLSERRRPSPKVFASAPGGSSFRIKIERSFDFLRISAIGMDEINQQFFASDAGSSGGGVGHSAFGEGLI